MNQQSASNLVIDIRGLYKTFHYNSDGPPLASALTDINLKISQGEFIAIIGQNGSGKTTLLRILAGIMKPSRGTIDIYAEMLAITDLGSGMVPDCTGYENIRMMGALYGVKGTALDAMTKAVEDYSELGDKLNLQTKFFSQGMYLRLAFSVLVFLKLDLMVFDEVLAVGDIYFRKKCLQYIAEIAKEGRTVVYVTHSFEEISDYCTRCIMLEDGKVKMDGDPVTVYNTYQQQMLNSHARQVLYRDDFEYFLEDCLRVEKVAVRSHGKDTSEVPFDEEFELEITWQKLIPDHGVTYTVFFLDSYGRALLSYADTYGLTHQEYRDLGSLGAGTYTDRIRIPGGIFNIGSFSIQVTASIFQEPENNIKIFDPLSVLSFDIVGSRSGDSIWKYAHSPFRMRLDHSREMVAEHNKRKGV